MMFTNTDAAGAGEEHFGGQQGSRPQQQAHTMSSPERRDQLHQIAPQLFFRWGSAARNCCRNSLPHHISHTTLEVPSLS